MGKRVRDPAWASGFIGIPFVDRGRDFRGADCWGLLRLVLQVRFGVEIPSYDDLYFHTRDFEAMHRIYDAQAKEDCWVKVMDRYERPGDECAGDAVHMRIDGRELHAGIIVAPGRMLHAHDGADSVIESIDGTAWRHRVLAIYRHRDLIGRQ